MKINAKILSIPPYISTSWKNIASLHVEHQHPSLVLVITLLSGVRIEVPDLEPTMIESIFAAHARYMEQEEKGQKTPTRTPLSFALGQDPLISLGIQPKNGVPGVEQFGAMLQHNPEQASLTDLPNDMLQKIIQLTKTLGIEDPNTLPKPEPHCNCMYCQIARAMQAGANEELPEKTAQEEEIVSDEDLKFKTWDVLQSGDKLFVVTNPLDAKEHYNVYLGDPIGCTCGETHCEHIRAVLSS